MENRSSINPLHSSFRKEQLQDWWESESDLQQHLLLTSSGDRQSIGQAGCNLSGGQRLRVGVARALYCSHQSTSIIVLDDPFSALDSHTSQNILQYLKNFARKENKTIVITTHSISLLQSEEEDPSLFMVLINDGCIVEQGSYSSLFHSSQDFRKLLSLTPPESARTIEILRNSDSINSMSQLKEADPIEDYKEGKIAEEYVSVEEVDSGDDIEDSNAGYIRSRVYKAYLRSAGIKTSIIIASFTLLMQIFSIFINLWLAYWATHQDDYSTRSFVFISSILMASMFITALVRSFMFAYGGLIAAQRLYEELSSAVFQSSISFFEKNTIGRILNRFGKDTNCIDDNLPFMINIVLAQFFQLLGASLVMAYNAPFIVPLLIVVGFVHYRLQYYYRQSSRELRRLDSVYKSPVYNLISECLHSAIVARSLSNKNNSCIEYFDLKLLEPQLDNSLRTSMSVTVAAQWFGIRLQLLGSATTTGLAVAIILNAMFSLLPVSAGLAGLSLIYSFSIVNNLNGLVSAVTETEQEMIAVERVLEYASLPSENFCEDEGNTTISKKPKIKTSSAFWCSCCGFTKHKGFTSEKEHAYKLLVGSQKEHAEDLLIMAENGDIPPVPFRIEDHSGVSIVFHDVCMKYDFNSSENTLHNINLNITSGDRVAVVGRTGSGKSSLIRVLLCLNYYYAGSIRISGHELRNVSATDLREMIGVIPQDPALFSGTVRTNLDPYEKHSTPELLHGLRLSNFANTIRVQSTVPEEATDMELERILNSEIIDGGKGLSQGQKQLICLARALVKKSPLLIFDEATASVDPHTERLIYKSLRDISYDVQNRISKPTMIMVCHKLDGVDAICNKVQMCM